MDQENYKNVVSLATHPTWKEKVKEIVTYSPTKIKKIPDPYYGTISDFESVFELLDTICGAIALEMTHNG
jgi:protein-tyrosine phosphatase